MNIKYIKYRMQIFKLELIKYQWYLKDLVMYYWDKVIYYFMIHHNIKPDEFHDCTHIRILVWMRMSKEKREIYDREIFRRRDVLHDLTI